MLDSFALYGQHDSKNMLDQLLLIPWFRERQHDLYRSVVAYKRVIESMDKETSGSTCVETQQEINQNVRTYIEVLKSLIHFDKRDEARVNRLINDPATINNALDRIFGLLG